METNFQSLRYSQDWLTSPSFEAPDRLSLATGPALSGTTAHAPPVQGAAYIHGASGYLQQHSLAPRTADGPPGLSGSAGGTPMVVYRGIEQDPFSPHCRIPLPYGASNYGAVGDYHFGCDNSFIRRRNARERERVRAVNEEFERLKAHLPLAEKNRRRVSKVDILRMARDYILALDDLLKSADAAGTTSKAPAGGSCEEEFRRKQQK